MSDKVIIASFGKTKTARTATQYQYNHGQKLQFENVDLPANYEVHFSNSVNGEAKTRIGDSTGVVIPPEYFIPGNTIYAWIYVTDEDSGITIRKVEIPISAKAKPTDQPLEPEDESLVEQIVNQLNETIDGIPNEINRVFGEAKESGEFDGESAYQIAVAHGFEGTESEWLKSLQGEDSNGIWWLDKSNFYFGPLPSLDVDFMARTQYLVGKEDENPEIGDLCIVSDRRICIIRDIAVISGQSTAVFEVLGDFSGPKIAEMKVLKFGFRSYGDDTYEFSFGPTYEEVRNAYPLAIAQIVTDVNQEHYLYPAYIDGYAFTGVNEDVLYTLEYYDTWVLTCSDMPKKADIDECATQEWVQDQGYLTQHQSLAGYATERWVGQQGYLTQHQSLSAYRTAAAQDEIDAAQDTVIAGKLSTTGNAYRSASIPMGQLDSTSTATVMTAQVDGITELRDGVCVWLKNGVVASASGVTLNINSLGAKPIYNSLSGAIVTTTFTAASTYLFVYNSTRVTGGCWDMVYGYDTNTTCTPVKLGFGYATCSTAEATTAKTADLSSYTLTTGGIVAVKFANAVPAGATLNINSKGAKAIYYKGAAITAGVIKAGDTVTMIYSTYYHVLSIDRDADTQPPQPSDATPWATVEGGSAGTSNDYSRADHQHPPDANKIGYDDQARMVSMTLSGDTVTCNKRFMEIYTYFSSQEKAFFYIPQSQYDYLLFEINRVVGSTQALYLSSIVGGILYQIVLSPASGGGMTGPLTTIDLNLQNASGVSF